MANSTGAVGAFFPGAQLSAENRAAIERIMQAALSAADPARAVARALVVDGRELVLGEHRILMGSGRLRVVGAGKASVAMAQGLCAVLGERVRDGVIITKHVPTQGSGLPHGLQVLPGSHPVPGEASVRSTEQLADYLQNNHPDDLVICLISGGG